MVRLYLFLTASANPKFVLSFSALVIELVGNFFLIGENYHALRGSRLNSRNTHGTGCTLASCIAAELAKGSPMLQAVRVILLCIETFCKCFDPSSSSSSSSSHDIREKEAATRDFIEAANACLGICRSHGVPLLINDRVDVALACDADGVHVGQSDMPARVARSILGPQKIIGVSCKTAAQAEQAWADGADYIGCGGVFPTTTKANNLTVGLDGFKAVCLASKLPVVAIGGISSANAGSVMEISVPSLKGVAVVSALFDRECIVTEARRLKSILMDSSTPHAKLMV
ncbi:hypothetical protein B296_00021104 [Ensete ventricosum]|uniref:thiamine phosphate synthase n=1 Tax=Ensete ventricosum TaxID=4639 RepID=A0A427B035_ENSVE|nr:hypothetical protein B296_00021104 [Ensete ventricosum]